MKIKKLIIHAADTPADMDIGAEEIRRWHVDPKPRGNGWSDIGYHYVIRRNGEIEKGRPDTRQGAHAAGHNAGSLGICLVGGMPDCNYTAAQWHSLESLVTSLLAQHPGAEVIGHRDVSDKPCPMFDAVAWARGLN